MNLSVCIDSLCGYGISLLSRNGRLVIQSATYSLSDAQTTCLKTHKALLLSLLPENSGFSPGQLLDAIESYDERVAIMSESGVPMATVLPVAVTQARLVLLSLPV